MTTAAAATAQPDISNPELLDDALDGLTASVKSLPCKYFYDAEGARLFEQICEQPEYYPTRTELSILDSHRKDIARAIGPEVRIVEFGSGAGIKTRKLLDALIDPVAYIPIDISAEQLARNAVTLEQSYPGIEILPLAADYHSDLSLPTPKHPWRSTTVFFPGSTLGNFQPDEARQFLKRMASIASQQDGQNSGGILIGIDLKKSPEMLTAAYNDKAGVTAAFNLNLLERLQQEAGAKLDMSQFQHQAIWNDAIGAMEMFLISRSDQIIEIGDREIEIRSGERIHTEHSHKYSLAEFAELASSAGLMVQQVWTDPDSLFSLQYLVAK